jgi:hypothetical protein
VPNIKSNIINEGVKGIFRAELPRNMKPMSKSLFKEGIASTKIQSSPHIYDGALPPCHLHRSSHHPNKEEVNTWGQGSHDINIDINLIHTLVIDSCIDLVVITNLVWICTCTCLIPHTPFI